MIVELGLAIAGTYAWNYLNAKDERKLKNKFENIMIKSGVKNREDETFKIFKLEKTSYGYVTYISNTEGLSLEHINSKLNIIEDNLNAIITIEKDRFKDYIKMYIVNRDISTFKFKPVKTDPHELYIGKDYKGQDYLLDVNKDAHILIGGATGTGKTFLLSGILTNLIYNSKEKIEIYLLQIAKSELSAFEDCSCVVNSSFTEQACEKALNSLLETIQDRSSTFRIYGIKNIKQWNKHHTSDYMKRIYVVIEEISFFIHREDLFGKICDISKVGRSVGVHIISCVQRSTATNIPPDLKSQMTRITFRQKSSIDSTNIINTPDAKSLKERECIVDGNSDYIQIKTAWIDEDYILLNKYVQDIKIPTKEKKQEILKVKKIKDKIIIEEEPEIIDVPEEDVTIAECCKSEQLDNHSGIISLEGFKNAKRKG
ncbi:FtsK/SpoIIIE domain-containing protein [Clostridium sp.]|uniref:FtsK/SpoIIIE domain-containing protein n=1 Tax=Clostridium sp. TaxID=1506 RepID=UPI00204805A2|nr:FtsK/SpoIIIE domain-containing protein [Clostridium sp.]MDU7260704.1 FtsK/SpoIIIE domain-containing protein [Clostridium butyricum]DAT56626.1 MAG TPA: DNA TRANSLOCASE FTSK [Caudoviricetes sp.]MDU1068156.1 FtsK/SpoIIIE domain-containing protein [Clostridium sp.]MDU2679730.1 FtsK/SpoIIIE domain-containing protein [Clostridium sp.]MDU4211911.1 FtsK/SpoIIIE domain-containing protein [Clostridium sp.]